MNERTSFDRLNALAPLILRLGVAAVLFYNGWPRLTEAPPTPEQPLVAAPLEIPDDVPLTEGTAPSTNAEAEATTQGVSFQAGWGTVLGAGEVGVAGLLLLGFYTRWAMLGVLAALGAIGAGMGGVYQGLPATVRPSSLIAVLLLGVACLTLLIAGSGSFGLDRMFSKRRQTRLSETSPT